MVGGTVCRNPYETGQALIAWSFSEWRYFDGWATASGIDLLKVSCPRFMHLVFHFLTKDTDKEGKEKLESILEEMESEIEFRRLKAEEQKIEVQTPEGETKNIVPITTWQAPPGWKPVGWLSDEENMKNAQQFMGWKPGGSK